MSKSVRYRDIIAMFCKLGATSFGGWSTAAVLLERELVTKRRLLTKREMDGAVVYAQVLPGATQVALVAGVAHRLHGARGAIVATIAYLTPSVAMMLLFAVAYFHFDLSLDGHIGGVQAALGGIILANAYKIGAKHVTDRRLWLAVALAAVLTALVHAYAIIVLFVYGVIGFISSVRSRRGRAV